MKTQHLSIAYMTNRRDCRIEWFFDSLAIQLAEHPTPVTIIVVDFWADEPGRRDDIARKAAQFINAGIVVKHTTPKPTVWQGRYRLATRDYFAAANARNTAICLAPDGWLAYVDDLSVLCPDWLYWCLQAIDQNVVGLGTYRKVRNLEVANGIIIGYDADESGLDSRIKHCRTKIYSGKQVPDCVPASGSWMFGCSLVGPVQGFLDINGWDEDCDSMSAEDYPCGMMLQNNGYRLMFMTKMMTFESEELHHAEKPFLRIDKPNVKGHKDASNAYLATIISAKTRRAPNYFEFGIAAERSRVLAGLPFTKTQIPEHDWRDSQPIREM